MVSRNRSVKAKLKLRAYAIEFDNGREALAARCAALTEQGMGPTQIARILNSEGIRTKRGRAFTSTTVSRLIANPTPPKPKPSKVAAKRARRSVRRMGVSRRSDKNLGWASAAYPHLAAWIQLARAWLGAKEAGVGHALQGVNAFLDFLAKEKLPAEPPMLLLHRTSVPNMYTTLWGAKRTQGKVLVNNCAHAFVEWVLGQPAFCEEDDDGRMLTSPAFRNPIPYMTRSGLQRPSESVRPTLPYGYIDELRRTIAEGPNFKDWTWAQGALGWAKSRRGGKKRTPATQDTDDEALIAPVWFEVDPSMIDRDDPDCVWRRRRKRLERDGVIGDYEVVHEMWSPVRWVAMLIKLQLPLRTMQVRMLDSGEADTWRWDGEDWHLNQGALAQGKDGAPYANGVFRKPTQLADGVSKLVLHVNTNKTADREKAGTDKGYDVPWITGGPMHQDPFYWLEKLRRWQEKYNPLKKLTPWSDLDGRHITVKSDVQLATYPDTAFLFRLPEEKRPDLPMAANKLDRPWFLCLEELEKRLAARGETMPNGDRIRLVPEQRTYNNATLFSLHSLRVSLITALALDGQVPLVILQKIAGHSRLVMTLYYTKPGAKQAQEAIQAGLVKLNEGASDSIIDWLANAEYQQLVKEVIANNLDTFKNAVAEAPHLRTPVGWMAMVDGLCLVGGNNVEVEAPGCHNGGINIGNDTSPRYAPVQGGARNCAMCRWFITRPYFLPQLAARWNNAYYHLTDSREQLVNAEERFRLIEDDRAETIAADRIFEGLPAYKEAQRVLERASQKYGDRMQTVIAITRLMERCREMLSKGDGAELLATGGLGEFHFAIETTDSELLQVSGVCEGTLLYPDLDAGKAVLRQGQLLDSALVRDNFPPLFMTLTESEQALAGSALMKHLATQMNPANPVLGRYEVISTIDARQSLRARLGPAMDEAIGGAISDAKPHRVIPIKATRELVEQ